MDVFYLFKDTQERREALLNLEIGKQIGFAEGQLFGFDKLKEKGAMVDCNLKLPRTHNYCETVLGWIERAYVARTGIGLGDVCSILAHLRLMNRAQVVMATSDNTGLPAAWIKERGLLKKPLVYVSIGLPERIKAVEKIKPARETRYRRRLKCVDRFVAYGWEEAEWLRQWIGEADKVHFIPFGVNTKIWRPMNHSFGSTDVLSIGADLMRDFNLLIEYARLRPDVGVCLITGKESAAGLGSLPPNLRIRIQIPFDELRMMIAGARVVVLPVKENTYSGATTTLVQCMAMGKAVAVSRVGAIRGGYGFQDGINLCWMEPGSPESLARVVDSLMADETACRRIGETARRHVEISLNWDRYVSDIEDCLVKWFERAKQK
mgnify:CR=1 FL=1